ncbi:MAG: hypothetical protein GAK36_00128 [Pseudomonas sp.]|nr:MAG: hypothetical protein GAK36_00128 [Pseudomonas sp.]
MNKWILLAAIAIAPAANAVDLSKSCTAVDCSAGTKAVTYAQKDDAYHACPTLELSDYVNGVVGFVSMTYGMTGKMPNVSPKTGEPEYAGETKDMIDNWRSAAKVSSFDEATAKCSKGKDKVQVIVMNSPEGGLSVWVADQKQNTFWLPRGHLFKR